MFCWEPADLLRPDDRSASMAGAPVHAWRCNLIYSTRKKQAPKSQAKSRQIANKSHHNSNLGPKTLILWKRFKTYNFLASPFRDRVHISIYYIDRLYTHMYIYIIYYVYWFHLFTTDCLRLLLLMDGWDLVNTMTDGYPPNAQAEVVLWRYAQYYAVFLDFWEHATVQQKPSNRLFFAIKYSTQRCDGISLPRPTWHLGGIRYHCKNQLHVNMGRETIVNNSNFTGMPNKLL